MSVKVRVENQKLLGHKKLNTTMVYARAYDQTIEADFFTTMGRIEQWLELTAQTAREPGLESEAQDRPAVMPAQAAFCPQISVQLCKEITIQMFAI